MVAAPAHAPAALIGQARRSSTGQAGPMVGCTKTNRVVKLIGNCEKRKHGDWHAFVVEGRPVRHGLNHSTSVYSSRLTYSLDSEPGSNSFSDPQSALSYVDYRPCSLTGKSAVAFVADDERMHQFLLESLHKRGDIFFRIKQL